MSSHQWSVSLSTGTPSLMALRGSISSFGS